MNRSNSAGRTLAASLAFLLSAGSVGLSGCGQSEAGSTKPAGDIRITVTIGGSPVSEGRVDVSTDKGGDAAGGELNASGVATLKNVPRGMYVVTVQPPLPNPAPPAPGEAAPAKPDAQKIPPKFHRFATSPLRAEVKEGTAEYQFDLKN